MNAADRIQWLNITRMAAPLYVRLELATYLRALGDDYANGLADDLEDPAPRVSRSRKIWN